MGSGSVAAALLVWLLPATVMAGVIRDLENQDDQTCTEYILDGLLHVDCSDRGLSDLPEGLDYTTQVLILSNNNFESFPTHLDKFSQLKTLDLSGNRLSGSLPSYLHDWNLVTLNLSNNNYDSWTKTGYTYTIERLDLSKNKINNIDEAAFNDVPYLFFLDLSENRIYNLPSKVFANTNKLDSLILSRNYFSDVPSIQSPSLRSLHLSNCQIENLNIESLAGMISLLEINLSINQIESIPENFASYTLQELDLSYNEITSLTDRTFSALPHLAVLDLRGNEFRDVWSTSHFASNPFLREVHVKGNRWSCEGFSVNLLVTYEFLTENPPKVSDTASLICYSPSNVTQMSWQQAYIRTWHPNDTEYTMLLPVMIGVIIGILVTSIVCRTLMVINKPDDPPLRTTERTVLNLNGTMPQPRVESVVMRIPLTEDLPPTYDEALLMPRLNTSFHSLPDFADEEVEPSRHYRRSRSIGDLTEARPHAGCRRSVRRTVQIRID